MSIRDFTSYGDSLVSPARSWRTVTPDDDQDLPDGVCKSIMVFESGDFSAIGENDDVAETVPVLAGMVIPVRFRRVMEATTATVMAFY